MVGRQAHASSGDRLGQALLGQDRRGLLGRGDLARVVAGPHLVGVRPLVAEDLGAHGRRPIAGEHVVEAVGETRVIALLQGHLQSLGVGSREVAVGAPCPVLRVHRIGTESVKPASTIVQ